MNWKDHFDAYKEHREVIDWAINRGLERSQRILGSHLSRAAVEMLAAYLIKEKKIEASAHLNHRWFKSSSIGEKMPDFQGKDEILKEMNSLENKAEILTYGAAKSAKDIKEAAEIFALIESRLKKLLGEVHE